MSDPENFLSRWSRLKQESNGAAGSEAATTPQSAAQPQAAARLQTATAPPAFDPASLPPVSSITQASDIQQFLQAGVPAELVRAALRAAWAADPTIRDFIGLADSQWDFNDPDAMPGFGPLDAADSARSFAQRSAAHLGEAVDTMVRRSDLVTRSTLDVANLPREGQVDGFGSARV